MIKKFMTLEMRNMKSFFGLREPFSALTHLLGFLLSIVGLIWLLNGALVRGTSRHIVAYAVFGTSLCLLYLASTLYHCLKVTTAKIIWLKRIDHMSIFVLIAGTYTPICLLAVGGTLGWWSLAGIWTLAILGMLCKVFWLGMPRWINVVIYLFMGWVSVILLPVLLQVMSREGLELLFTGGIIYSLGAVIYALKKPNIVAGVWEFHETWHLFVMAGSVCHFLAIGFYLV